MSKLPKEKLTPMRANKGSVITSLICSHELKTLSNGFCNPIAEAKTNKLPGSSHSSLEFRVH